MKKTWDSNFSDLPFDRSIEPIVDTDVPNDMITVPLDENRSENLDPGQPPTPNTDNAENGQIRPRDMTTQSLQNSPNSNPPTNNEPETMASSPSTSGEIQLRPVCRIYLTKKRKYGMRRY